MRTMSFFALLIFIFSSCKKSGSDEETLVKPEDPVALSKAVSVWHGTRVTGNPPAPTNNPNSPVLEPQSNNQTIKAIAGRYAIVQPQLVSGSVAGYYIQINGASDYFKVDYSKPRNTGGRQAVPGKKPSLNKSNFKIFGTDSTGGNVDSAIVISIPPTIQAGELCITYCVYDAAGNISNLITTCITVTSFGGDATISYLAGVWHMTAERDDTSQVWYPVIYSDTSYSSFTCVNNKLSYDCPTSNCNFSNYIVDISNGLKADFTFNSNGGLKYEVSYSYKNLNLDSSTCSNLIYTSDGFSDQISGAWSYTTSTNKLVMVFDLNSSGQTEPEAYEFVLEKISDKVIYLHDPVGGYALKFEK